MRRVLGWLLVVLGTAPAAFGVVFLIVAVARLLERMPEGPVAVRMLWLLGVGLTLAAVGFGFAAPRGARRPIGTLVLRAIGMAMLVGGPLWGTVATGLANFDSDSGATYWPQGWAIAAGGVVVLVVAVRIERVAARRPAEGTPPA